MSMSDVIVIFQVHPLPPKVCRLGGLVMDDGCLSFCVSLVQAVLHLSPNGSWNRLQPLCNPLDNKQLQIMNE